MDACMGVCVTIECVDSGCEPGVIARLWLVTRWEIRMRRFAECLQALNCRWSQSCSRVRVQYISLLGDSLNRTN